MSHNKYQTLLIGCGNITGYTSKLSSDLENCNNDEELGSTAVV